MILVFFSLSRVDANFASLLVQKNALPANSLTRISSRYSSTSKNLSRSHLTENRLDDELGTASIPATVWSSTVMIETFASFSMSDLSIDIGERMSCMHTGVSISCLISCNGNLYSISKIHFYVEFFSLSPYVFFFGKIVEKSHAF